MIRKANFEDLEAINVIYNQAVNAGFQTADLEHTSLDERKEWFLFHSPEKYPVYVMEKEGGVIAWLSLSPYRKGRKALESVAEICHYIHEDFQSQGIGSSFMNFAIEEARKFEFKNLVAILLSFNHRSIQLLEKFQFTQWGAMPNIAHIEGQEVDHLYYGLRL